MAVKPAKGNQGKRYSAEDKAEIVSFIQAYNAEHKRGGMKAASDKFGVSVVTLSNWGKGGKKRRTKAKVRKAVKAKAAPKLKPTLEGADAVLKRLQAIRGEITVLEKEFNTLKKKL